MSRYHWVTDEQLKDANYFLSYDAKPQLEPTNPRSEVERIFHRHSRPYGLFNLEGFLDELFGTLETTETTQNAPVSMDKQYTSNGRPVRVLCVDAKGAYPVKALSDLGDVVETVVSFTSQGVYNINSPESSMNLKEVKPKRTGWVNVYQAYDDASGAYLEFSDLLPTKPQADKCVSSHRIACIEVSFVEGAGLE